MGNYVYSFTLTLEEAVIYLLTYHGNVEISNLITGQFVGINDNLYIRRVGTNVCKINMFDGWPDNMAGEEIYNRIKPRVENVQERVRQRIEHDFLCQQEVRDEY